VTWTANLFEKFMIGAINEIINSHNTIYIAISFKTREKGIASLYSSTLKAFPGSPGEHIKCVKQ